MSARRREAVLWAVVLAVCLSYWAVAIDTRLFIVAPLEFVGWTALAAAILTGLFVWAVRSRGTPET
jgi:hypothetical protein